MSATQLYSVRASACTVTTGPSSLAEFAHAYGYPSSVSLSCFPSGPIWLTVWLAFQGGAFVSTMINCVVGNSWKNLSVSFPESVGCTVQRFVGFLIFWAFVLPFCSLRPTRLKWLYTFKAWLLPPSVLGLLTYCLVQSKGKLAGTAALAGTDASQLPRGATLVWLMVSSINSCMGNWVSELRYNTYARVY